MQMMAMTRPGGLQLGQARSSGNWSYDFVDTCTEFDINFRSDLRQHLPLQPFASVHGVHGISRRCTVGRHGISGSGGQSDQPGISALRNISHHFSHQISQLSGQAKELQTEKETARSSSESYEHAIFFLNK